MKKSPKGIIEDIKDPHLESAYLKFPGREMQEVSLERNRRSVSSDPQKIEKLVMERCKVAEKRYNMGLAVHSKIHTHPTEKGKPYGALPSRRDMTNFLGNTRIRNMVIAQTDPDTGKTQGYFVLRKKGGAIPRFFKDPEEIKEGVGFYGRIGFAAGSPSMALKQFAEGFNLQYRWIPAKGYELADETKGNLWSFVKRNSEGALEKGLQGAKQIAIIIGFIGALFFLSPKITGHSIGNRINPTTIGIITILFILGLTIFYLRKRYLIKKRLEINIK